MFYVLHLPYFKWCSVGGTVSGSLGCSRNVKKWGVYFVDLLKVELCANCNGLRQAAQLAVLSNIVRRYFFMSLLKRSACPFTIGWFGVTTYFLTDMSLQSSSSKELANSLPLSEISCCIGPQQQIHSLKMAFVTVVASLFSIRTYSIQLVKAYEMTATYLYLMSLCSGPKRSLCTLSFGLWHGGHGVSSAFLGGRCALWHKSQYFMNSVTSWPMVGQKNDWLMR